MKIIVAFMQNLWVKDVERTKLAFQKHGEKYRRSFIKYSLFAGCKSGQNLRATFNDLCDMIIWEESTKEIGNNSKSSFPPDYEHIFSVLNTEKPIIVITFGSIAFRALTICAKTHNCYNQYQLFSCLHPACRHPNLLQNLRVTAKLVNEAL